MKIESSIYKGNKIFEEFQRKKVENLIEGL